MAFPFFLFITFIAMAVMSRETLHLREEDRAVKTKLSTDLILELK
jgi:hypothetical protein